MPVFCVKAESGWLERCGSTERAKQRAVFIIYICENFPMATDMIKIDNKEIYRYLGYRRGTPEPEVVRAVDSCVEELRREVTPRYVYRLYPVESIFTVPGAENPEAGFAGPENIRRQGLLLSGRREEKQIPLLCIAGMEIRSRSLSRNLRGCENVYLMAATLGIGPDRLIARASVTHMSRAVILQAASAAMIEAWCDEVNQRIIKEAAAQGLYCRPRFSPGYGDFRLEYQQDFAQILRMQKEIGVSLTESLLMMPSKSVTAVIGVTAQKQGCVLHGCEVCEQAPHCAFSRNGD